MDTGRQIRCTASICAWLLLPRLGLGSNDGGGASTDPPTAAGPAAAADSSASSAAEPSLPQQGFFSSLKQAADEDFAREVVRGHFDLGTPPNTHRYYCLLDPKTGRKQPNGVLGQPFAVPGGLTRIKETAVSLYRCADAEKAGLLITTGYVTGMSAPGQGQAAQGQAAPEPAAAAAPANAVATPPPAASTPAASPTSAVASSGTVDVAGIKLGMSPDEVRRVLRAKQLPDYFESIAAQTVAGARFVNIIATWAQGADGESYAVMFTPVPGEERAMAIVHSVVYSPANAVPESSHLAGLVQQYGGFATPGDVPESPTWRFQDGGQVLVGDPCHRRAIFGALHELNVAGAPWKNVALETTLAEFRFQMEHCGTAIVTEDHVAAIAAAQGGAPHEQRTITRFTVTAYSPSIAFDGAASAAQRLQTAAGSKASPPTSDSSGSRK